MLNDKYDRIWDRMINLCDSYLQGNTELRFTIDSLQDLFLAADIHNKKYYDRFYAIWGDIEAAYAVSLGGYPKLDYTRVKQRIIEMKQFLHDLKRKGLTGC